MGISSALGSQALLPAGLGFRNLLINGDFSIWQRGTSVAGSGTAFLADRWQAYRGTTGSTFSRQVTNDTTNLPFIQYCLRAQRDSGNTSTTPYSTGQNFESVNSIPLAGKTVVLSFYARAGANYSAASGALEVNLATGTGTDQNIYTGLTGRANPILQNATLTTTWQRFTYSATLATTATQVAMSFAATPVGTAGAADYFEVTGVQLEVANTASPYAPNGATYQAELAACQRYLPAITGQYNQMWGAGNSTTGVQYGIKLPVTARVAPTGITVSSAGHFTIINSGFATGAATAITWNTGGTDYVTINTTHTAGSPTIAINQPVGLQWTNASALILFTGCEL
jgi:hypothetical protein